MNWQREEMAMICRKRSRMVCCGTRKEQQQEKLAEDLQGGRVVAIHRNYDEQHSA
jgi:hypothetical protein